MDGKPVIARQDSLRYRAGKFILRNRLQVAAGLLVAASMVAGLGISLVQTHRANAARASSEAERLIALRETSVAQAATISESQQKEVANQQRVLASKQRDEAEQEKALADQRVKDIFELADRTLFDAHDAIAVLPGSLAARKALVKTTLEYLQSLEKNAGLDDDMREALCAAYYKIAMIQGDPQGASLQDSAAAETSLLKGQAILMPAYNIHPNSPGLMLRLIETRASLAELKYRSGRREEGVQAYIDLLPVAHRLSFAKICTLNCKTQEPFLENSITYELMGMDPPRALEHANHGIALMRALLVRNPEEPTLEQGLGTLMAAGAGVYRMLGDLDKAAEYYRESIAAREVLYRKEPHSNLLRRGLMVTYGNYTALLGNPWSPNLGRPAEARVYGAKCVALARETVAADKTDVTARHDLGMSLSRLGTIDPAPDGTAESLAELEEAGSLLQPIVDANPKSAELASQLSLVLEYVGHRMETLGRKVDAAANYQKSMAVIHPFVDAKNAPNLSQYLASEQSLALLDASNGNTEDALDLANRALSEAEKLSVLSPDKDAQSLILAKVWSGLALIQSKAGMGDQAKVSATKAMKQWGSVKKTGLLLPFRQTMAETQALLGPAEAGS
jgi:tetratricopeptide (TPR) repeat protein